MLTLTEEASSSVYVMVSGVVQDYPQQLPLDDPYACDKGLKCPVQAGTRQQYNETVLIDYDFPVVCV